MRFLAGGALHMRRAHVSRDKLRHYSDLHRAANAVKSTLIPVKRRAAP